MKRILLAALPALFLACYYPGSGLLGPQTPVDPLANPSSSGTGDPMSPLVSVNPGLTPTPSGVIVVITNANTGGSGCPMTYSIDGSGPVPLPAPAVGAANSVTLTLSRGTHDFVIGAAPCAMVGLPATFTYDLSGKTAFAVGINGNGTFNMALLNYYGQ